ncbi:SidA/IucD/PvdA family monooxygenase [uncultured Shewanella sp.]|uniref:lysine N(6)-hydroxylase/L-ornithine N(5)-oxygenase family protein n=1 Tax=uncultured Shewanella sp. TaxID=173975 RepID=UPI002615F3F5|nr:SidA/IucD/PvdA family monooxygenase [uncultured Shewanella sp.]
MMQDPIYDFIAIGLGPFNLGLACLSEPIEELTGIFLDKNEGFDWHPGMMIEGSHLQTPFMADLVTLADPTNPLSFLNYIKKQGRMYSFYIKESFFLMRQEYNQYCQWATQELSNIRFNTCVNQVTFNEDEQVYVIEANDTKTDELIKYKTKKLVLGTGPAPYIPDACEGIMHVAHHSATYMEDKASLQQQKSITIVGSGQSAAEIFYDLLQDIDTYGYQLNWVTRAPRYYPLEYSKLTLEMTSPEYVDYFHDLPAQKRDELMKNQKHLYKGINSCLINEIYDLLYIKRLSGDVNVNMLTNANLIGAKMDDNNGHIQLEFHQEEQDKRYQLLTEGLVLSTGYAYRLPDFLEGITHRIKWDQHGRFDVNRNYSIDHHGQEIFVQNAELHTHGFVTPDLGMAAYRNSYLLREITGVEHYQVETQIAFQQFDTPTSPITPFKMVDVEKDNSATFTSVESALT